MRLTGGSLSILTNEVSNISEFTYTREDFDTPAPYEYICAIKDPFQQNVAERNLSNYAKEAGFKAFKTSLKAYRESLKNASRAMAVISEDGVTQFDDQMLELNTGEWTADDFGVRRAGGFGTEDVACPHPIMPIERLRNIDTGELKVRLAFRRGLQNRKSWTVMTADFDTIANAKNIVSLSKIGISVTSGKRAQNLVDYLTDIMDLNYDTIPETKSVSRMGWNDEGFAPYVKDVVFDGNENFRGIYSSIRQHGDYEAWIKEAKECRKYSITARLVLAASFASVLVGPLGCLPFFVHLWGMDSGTGKTVAQMLAASVWANPAVGGAFFPTFKATSVGFEVLAGFLNSLPIIIDELQLAKDYRGKVNFNVYELASGSGKLRSNKTLGLASTPTWANCFITSGETPLVGENDGAGAVNRVIEIECKADAKAIKDGHKTSGILKANYGHAGKAFIDRLCRGSNLEEAHKLYEIYYEDCLKNNTTEKQAMAAALILAGDFMASQWIFEDKDDVLTVDAIADFLKSREAVSAADRGYDYMCDWVAQNAGRFRASSDERYGQIADGVDEGWVYIIRATAWNKACADAGISSQALLSHLKSRGLIQTRGKGFTKTKRIGGIPSDCVVMKLKEDPDAWANGEPDEQLNFNSRDCGN